MTKRFLAVVLLLTGAAWAQTGYNASRTFVSNIVAADIGLQQSSHIIYHQVAWAVTNAPASCTFTVDSSVDGVTWTGGGIIGSTSCTAASGSTVITLANANFIRLDVTALTAASVLTLNYTGWAFNPSGTGDAGFSSNGAGVLTLGATGVGNGGITYKGTTSGTIGPIGCTAAACTIFGSVTAPAVFKQIGTGSVCAATGSAANPSAAACTSAASGSFSCSATASTGTCVVSTTSLTANSIVLVTAIASGGGLTCNGTADTALTAPRLASISVGASFTINLGTFTTTAECFNYLIIN